MNKAWESNRVGFPAILPTGFDEKWVVRLRTVFYLQRFHPSISVVDDYTVIEYDPMGQLPV